MTFNLTQLLFLVDRDIVYWYIEQWYLWSVADYPLGRVGSCLIRPGVVREARVFRES